MVKSKNQCFFSWIELFNIWVEGLVRAIKKAKLSNNSHLAQIMRYWGDQKMLKVSNLHSFLANMNLNTHKDETRK